MDTQGDRPLRVMHKTIEKANSCHKDSLSVEKNYKCSWKKSLCKTNGNWELFEKCHVTAQLKFSARSSSSPTWVTITSFSLASPTLTSVLCTPYKTHQQLSSCQLFWPHHPDSFLSLPLSLSCYQKAARKLHYWANCVSSCIRESLAAVKLTQPACCTLVILNQQSSLYKAVSTCVI